jgi:hypothetical protein
MAWAANNKKARRGFRGEYNAPAGGGIDQGSIGHISVNPPMRKKNARSQV